MHLKTTIAAIGAVCAIAAEAEQALIISNFNYADTAPFGDVRAQSLKLSETLFGLGYTVNRLENPSAAEISTATGALANAEDPVVIYYAGRTVVRDDATYLVAADGQDEVALADLFPAPASRPATLVFLDVCTTPAAPEPVNDAVVEETPEITPIPAAAALAPLPPSTNLFVAASVAAGAPCAEAPALSEVMLERLLVPGLGLDSFFADTGVTVTSTLSTPFLFRNVDTGMRLTAEDYRMLDSLSPEAQAQMLALWREAGIAVDQADANPTSAPARRVNTETVVLSSPIRPVTSGATLTPVRPSATRVSGGCH
uniref:Caspase family protein n=1 Tax=Yoonia rhodophyticola TaxID=3137370 RepID=A0AAN0MEB6_9RHOB